MCAFNYKKINKNNNFIGRASELKQLASIAGDNSKARILVIYGRRRIGKTELIEQSLASRNIIKIEGIEGKEEGPQLSAATLQLNTFLKSPLLDTPSSWIEFFIKIAENLPTKQPVTLYLEELQWLADYKSDLIAELKFVWDNHFKNFPNLLLVLCGSSPSFMVTKVLRSKSLHNRSMHELHLQELNFQESCSYLGGGLSLQAILDMYLSVGGIPPYLDLIKQQKSAFASFCKHAFTKNGFFNGEAVRIFVSSLAENQNYKKIVEFLANQRFASSAEIYAHLKREKGGDITALLRDLTLCGFIKSYSPFQLGAKSKLVRYHIADKYLNLYYRFIAPNLSQIMASDFDENPTGAIHQFQFQQHLGYAFERYVRDNHKKTANILGFSGIKYTSGTFFSRATSKINPGFQWDLVFDRSDQVLTVCEIKYSLNPVDKSVIQDFEERLKFLPLNKYKSIQKVLISNNSAGQQVLEAGYFDVVIDAQMLLSGW